MINRVTTFNEHWGWADQLRAELEKQSSARACQIEPLLTAGDYQAIRDFLELWEADDRDPDSTARRYQQAVKILRAHSWMKITEGRDGETSADSLTGSSAGSDQTTAANES